MFPGLCSLQVPHTTLHTRYNVDFQSIVFAGTENSLLWGENTGWYGNVRDATGNLRYVSVLHENLMEKYVGVEVNAIKTN